MFAALARRYGGAAFAILMMSSLMPVLAQTPSVPLPQPVILLVDSQLVTQQCMAGQAIRNQHDQYRQAIQNDLEADHRALKQKEDELVREKAVLSHESWQIRAREFEQHVIDYNQRVAHSNLAIERAYGVAMAELWRDFTAVSAEIAGEEGANLVLPIQQAVYLDPRMDQTQAVIERMNKKYPVIVFPPPAIETDRSPAAVKN